MTTVKLENYTVCHRIYSIIFLLFLLSASALCYQEFAAVFDIITSYHSLLNQLLLAVGSFVLIAIVLTGLCAWLPQRAHDRINIDWPLVVFSFFLVLGILSIVNFTGETQPALSDISGARILALLGDSITTDHISPAGSIAEASPAGRYLKEHGVEKKDFNSYGSRRGNHEVMMRGTFANVRIKNEMCPGVEGGVTRLQPDGDEMSIYDAAMKYLQQNTPLVVIAGSEYGTGSSRDWAAKGTRLLGVKAVIAESFERIHRSNLVGMGVLPLEFPDGVNRKTLQLDGSEQIELAGLAELTIGAPIVLTVVRSDGSRESCELKCRLDTEDEFQYFISGGILHYVLKQLVG